MPLGVGSSAVWTLDRFADLRGSLTPIEFDRDLPFSPVRLFLVYGASDQARGDHAHRTCRQFLVATHGQVSVAIDDGEFRCDIVLDDPTKGLYVPSMVWAVQHKFSSDAVLMVMASHAYDPADYIGDYDEFRRVVAATRAAVSWAARFQRSAADGGAGSANAAEGA